MEARACSLLALYLALTATAARECIEITLPDKIILNDSIFNGTFLKIAARNESLDESAKYNVLGLWDRFPRVVVPRNATSEQCRKDGQLYMDSLERLELWALK
ncbi:Drop dead, partial [Operophtera brumata]